MRIQRTLCVQYSNRTIVLISYRSQPQLFVDFKTTFPYSTFPVLGCCGCLQLQFVVFAQP